MAALTIPVWRQGSGEGRIQINVVMHRQCGTVLRHRDWGTTLRQEQRLIDFYFRWPGRIMGNNLFDHSLEYKPFSNSLDCMLNGRIPKVFLYGKVYDGNLIFASRKSAKVTWEGWTWKSKGVNTSLIIAHVADTEEERRNAGFPPRRNIFDGKITTGRYRGGVG